MRRALVAVAMVAAGGCKLSEVIPAAPSTPFLVVHGVIYPNAASQFVLVEESDNAIVRGVSGATVTLTLPEDRCSPSVVPLAEGAATTAVPGASGGVYGGSLGFGCVLRAGDIVVLRVQTRDGRIVTGRTRIPGIQDISVSARRHGIVSGPGDLDIDRTTDTLVINTVPYASTAMQAEVVRDDVGGFITYRLATGSRTLSIAGDLVDPFDGDGRTVFRAGAVYRLSVAAVDTNYFDFVRSGADPFTGKGFINHLDGAVGVFGSVTPVAYIFRVRAPRTDPREGVYRLTGTLANNPVDATIELYRDPLGLNGNAFSGFVSGVLAGGLAETSANFAVDADSTGASRPNAFTGTIYAQNLAFGMSGTRAARGTAFPVEVTYDPGTGVRRGTLNMVQVSGP